MKLIRVQLSRKKGFRLPPETVIVDRRSKWGNPFHVPTTTDSGSPIPPNLGHAIAVANYRNDMDIHIYREIQAELRGKNIACWCSLSLQCHGDVILEIANKKR